ncbi:MAG: hypothetical protein A2977_00300 [Alphaproteobacteria bacterium RIFCSPLOWO2_01_FULL_45_8]|nr:MAG: hypothetical protein A2065_04255 [Alphaproteobacteria bacterium GWB1_45_5]OFW96324.1 MAG: hypothetical protein A2977_00300 [Alphaproteobacteria bacterium RIFCSPLOWO2_01_FULL_45_8]HCI48995.1 hypothetical protein [Holosporales bacterium]
MINHIILFKFKRSLTKQEIAELLNQIRTLSEYFPGIQNFSWGPRNSSEKDAHGFEYGLLLQFDSEETRKQYFVHPLSAEISKNFAPALEGGEKGALSFDYEV